MTRRAMARSGFWTTPDRDLQDSGVRVENHAIFGDPAEALLQTAEANRARLIVIGSKGMSGARRYCWGACRTRCLGPRFCAMS